MLDIIGTLYTQDAEPVALPGWHVNSPHPVEGWERYRVEPSSPRRVFADHPTFYYVFPDDATFDLLRSPDEAESI